MNLKTILARAIHRIDFWTVRSPLSDQPSLRSPDYILRAMPRDEARREIAWVVPTHTEISNFKNTFLAWRRDCRDQFSVMAGDKRLRELVTEAFLDQRYNAPPLFTFGAGLEDLDDLLRSIVEELFVEGTIWMAAFWRTHRKGRRQIILPQFRLLRRDSVNQRKGAVTLRLR